MNWTKLEFQQFKESEPNEHDMDAAFFCMKENKIPQHHSTNLIH